MIQNFLEVDRQLFLVINHLPHTFFLHSFFASLSGVGQWGIIWVLIAVALFFWEKRKNHQKLISLFLGLGISSVVVELVKNFTRRIRPEEAIPVVIALTEKSTSYSFPSGHATVAFAAAYILSRGHKSLKWINFILAFLIALSRVYLGKHYPSDVLVGILSGLLIGYLSMKIVDKLFTRPTKL